MWIELRQIHSTLYNPKRMSYFNLSYSNMIEWIADIKANRRKHGFVARHKFFSKSSRMVPLPGHSNTYIYQPLLKYWIKKIDIPSHLWYIRKDVFVSDPTTSEEVKTYRVIFGNWYIFGDFISYRKWLSPGRGQRFWELKWNFQFPCPDFVTRSWIRDEYHPCDMHHHEVRKHLTK